MQLGSCAVGHCARGAEDCRGEGGHRRPHVRVRVAAGVGLWDRLAGAYLTPGGSASATEAGGATGLSDPAAFFNVAFRFEEPLPELFPPFDPVVNTAWWRDKHQGVQAELGWCLDPAHQGRGYATEAVQVMCAWMLGPRALARVIATIDAGNLPSLLVIERAGQLCRSGGWTHSAELSCDWLADVETATHATDTEAGREGGEAPAEAGARRKTTGGLRCGRPSDPGHGPTGPLDHGSGMREWLLL